MVYFLNASGDILRCVPDRVRRGSAEANKIVLVAPFSESAAAAAEFVLPSGRRAGPYLLTYEGRLGANGLFAADGAEGENADGTAQESTESAESTEQETVSGQTAAGSARADGETDTESGTGAGGGSVCGGSSGGAQCGSACGACTYVWSLSLPACVSAESGRVGVSFFFYAASGEVMAAASISFLVEAGAAAPSVPTEGDAYGEVLAMLAQIAGGLGDGAYPARSLRLWREGVQYDAGETVLCTASEEGGANLVRSLQDSNAQPPYTDGVLDETWEEVYSFEGAIQPFASFFAELALSKIVWAAQLPEEGESGTLYAVLSSSDASLFALYVFRDGEWVTLGEKNVSVLPNGDAVLFTEQQLTSAQQAQARENIGAVSEEQLAAGLNGLAAVLSEGEAVPADMREGAGVYSFETASLGDGETDHNFTDPAFSSADWTVVSGGGTAPVFGDDGLTIAEGLFAERGAVAAANPLKGEELAENGMTVALYLTVSGNFLNDYESIFGFADAEDSANSAFRFFTVTSNGTGVRMNWNGAGNLGENYYDIAGGSVADMTAPTLYVLTMTAEEIAIYCGGELIASYAYSADGANTSYRVETLSKIAQADFFILGCCTGLLGWGNPAMHVRRAMLCPRALRAEEVAAFCAQSGYRLGVLLEEGGDALGEVKVRYADGAAEAESAEKLKLDGEVGRYSAVYFTEEGKPAENPYIKLRYGSAPFYSYIVSLGRNASASDAGIAIGDGASASAGVAVGVSAEAGNTCDAVGTYASAQGSGLEGASAFGFEATATASHTIQLGGSANSYVYYYGTLSSRSDERDKADLVDFDDAKSLQFITSLRTFSYVRNPRGAYEYTEEERAGARELHREYGLAPYDAAAHEAGTKKGSRRRAGVSAQDVQAKMQAVYGDEEIANLVCDNLYDRRQAGEEIPEGVESQLEVSYLSLVPFLISAVREQQRHIAALEEALGIADADADGTTESEKEQDGTADAAVTEEE